MEKLEEILTAIYRKDFAAVRQLTWDEVNVSDPDGRTPLMHAVLAEDADPAIVKLLIERGADVDAVDRGQEWTALHFAARYQKAPIVRALLETGIDVDLVDAVGNTPLWHSVMNAGSDLSVIRELVRRGADPTRRNKERTSPIDLAITTARADITAIFAGRGNSLHRRPM